MCRIGYPVPTCLLLPSLPSTAAFSGVFPGRSCLGSGPKAILLRLECLFFDDMSPPHSGSPGVPSSQASRDRRVSPMQAWGPQTAGPMTGLVCPAPVLGPWGPPFPWCGSSPGPRGSGIKRYNA